MEEMELPDGWQVANFGDDEIAFTTSGGTPDRSNPDYFGGDIRWVKSGELDDNLIYDTDEKITRRGLENSSAKVFPAGTLLVAMYGATAGKTAILAAEASTNQAICAIFPRNQSFHPQFLQFYLIKIRDRILSARSGGAQPNISQRIIKSLEVILPPLPEQHAIARALRAVQEARAARQREAALERERKAALMELLFTHGTRGEATKETEIGEVPKSWRVVKLGTLISDGPQNGLYKPMELYGNGTPIVRIDDFDNEGVFTSPCFRRVQVTSDEVEKYCLREGDILINRVNSLSHLGKCSFVPSLNEPTVFESNMMRFRVNTAELLPEYAFRYLLTENVREWLRGKARRAVAQSSINQGDVKSLPVPVPSLPEQNQMVTVIGACDAGIATLEREISLLDELFRAMLEELMTGRLSALGLIELAT